MQLIIEKHGQGAAYPPSFPKEGAADFRSPGLRGGFEISGRFSTTGEISPTSRYKTGIVVDSWIVCFLSGRVGANSQGFFHMENHPVAKAKI
jgi:hypothetical protein